MFLRPKYWESNKLINLILLPFAMIYFIIYRIRFLLTVPYKSKINTICVGNYVIGGSGKTPATITVAKYLQSIKKNVCIISRGYRGSLIGPVLVDSFFHNYKHIGDEAMLLSESIPTIIAKNKVEGIKLAEKNGFEAAVFDDGLQNPSVRYDLKILMYDENFGNNLIFPAGPLREPVERAISRSDIILYEREIPHEYILFKNKWFKYEICSDVDIEKKTKVILFTGIGNPKKFFDYIGSYGYKIIESVSFPDHHIYSDNDIKDLLEKAKKFKSLLVTTEKDYVKIPSDLREHVICIPIYYKIDNIDFILKDICQKD